MVWIEYLPAGWIVQCGVDCEPPAAPMWGGTVLVLGDEEWASLAEAILQDPAEPVSTLPAAEHRAHTCTAMEIHLGYYYIAGRFRARRTVDRGKAYYPDTSHFQRPHARGTGSIPNALPPVVTPQPFLDLGE